MNQGNPDRSPQVLLVEDDSIGGEQLARFLRSFGYQVKLARGEAEALALLDLLSLDAAIVDLTLTDGDGFGVLDALRTWDPLLPILCTSGRGDLHDRVMGLKAGFDHYLAKPFEPLELEALLATALRRRELIPTASASETFARRPGRWQLICAERCLRLDETLQIPLSQTELRFLSRLYTATDPVDRDSLIRALGHSQRYYTRSRLDSLVSRLRQKVANSTSVPAPFVSVYGSGYAWMERPEDSPE